jgi:hypothetical protein
MTLSRGLSGRKAALAALAVAIAGGGGLLVLLAAWMFSGLRADAADNLHDLTAYRSEIAAQPAVEAELARLRSRIDSTTGLVHADASAPAAAQVQTAVKALVEASGGELRSAQVLPATKDKDLETIALQCDVTLPLGKLRQVLYAIETHRPYLFIDPDDITAPINFDTKTVEQPDLELRLTVKAYRWASPK